MEPDDWAIVELMGHVKMAGRVSEVERFGAKMGRIDIPYIMPDCKACNGTGRVVNPPEKCNYCTGFVAQFFGGNSVYRITPVSEEVARDTAKRNTPEPVSPWDYPKQLGHSPTLASRDDDFDSDCEERDIYKGDNP